MIGNLKSKALDPSKYEKKFSLLKKVGLYSWYLESDAVAWVQDKYRALVTTPIYQVKKLYQWQTNVFFNDFDFDAHSIYPLLHYKLKRIEDALKNGCAIQEPKDMKALALAIKIADRIKSDQYEELAMERHDLKWGRPDYSFEPYFRCERPAANTPELLVQERNEAIAVYARAESTARKDRRTLFAIIAEYERVWWD